MMSYVGKELPWDFGCGFTDSVTHKVCGAKPVVRHYVFKERIVQDGEEYHPTGFSCDRHTALVVSDSIWMWHPVSSFCLMKDSSFHFEVNECTVDYKDY